MSKKKRARHEDDANQVDFVEEEEVLSVFNDNGEEEENEIFQTSPYLSEEEEEKIQKEDPKPNETLVSYSTLRLIQHALKKRIQDPKDPVQVMCLEKYVTEVEMLFERTIRYGENQSALMTGSVGSGTDHIISHAMQNLRKKHGAFRLIYLNGGLLQNEIEAFKEILAQLLHDDATKRQNISYVNMYDSLKEILSEKAQEKETIMIVLEELEHFAIEGKAKQLLLYNLLDWLQTKDVRMGVLGVTTNFNLIQNLEKRVRSRFSNLQVIVTRPSLASTLNFFLTLLSLKEISWNTISRTLPNTPKDLEFLRQFDVELKNLVEEEKGTKKMKPLRAMLQFEYDLGKALGFFRQFALLAVCHLSLQKPFFQFEMFQQAKEQMEPNHQLILLQSLSNQELALLIGMGHLEKNGQRFFSFEMVYEQWQQFCRKFDLQKTIPSRHEALKSLEILLKLELVQDAGDAFKIGNSGGNGGGENGQYLIPPEYQVVHLNLDPRTLEGMIRNKSIKCSAALMEWALNH